MDKNNRRLCRKVGRTLIDIMILQAVYSGVDMVEGIWIQWIHVEAEIKTGGMSLGENTSSGHNSRPNPRVRFWALKLRRCPIFT
jgi:hypothetical protein